MFEKNHKLSQGRPKGAKNKEDLNSLRKLLEGCFHENRLVIRDTLNSLCKDVSDQVKALNAKVLDSKDENLVRAYSVIRAELLEDFKWLMELKVKTEPKQVEMGGLDGELLKPPTIVFQSIVHADIGTTQDEVLSTESSIQGIELSK